MIREQAFNQIQPFAQFLLQMGVDPMKFLQTPQGAALLAPLREATAREFEQARMNTIDMGAGAGFSPGSGLIGGPLANLFGAEAAAQSENLRNFFGNSLNLGLQGANVLQGQQATFNPQIPGGLSNQAAHTVINAPPGAFMGSILPAAIGAGGTALGGLLGRPQGGGSLAYQTGSPIGYMPLPGGA